MTEMRVSCVAALVAALSVAVATGQGQTFDVKILPVQGFDTTVVYMLVGAGANIQDHCLLHCFPDAACIVEDEGHIGHGAVLHGATVRRNALVGMNAVLMDGSIIGESAFVAAMSFVP